MSGSNGGPATKKQLREFGLVVGGAFLVLATAQLIFHGKLNPMVLYVIGGVLVVCGLVVPQILRPFNWFWMKLSVVLGWVMNRVLLGLIFYVIFTIVATIMRLQKRDALRRHKDPAADSFWQLRPATPTPAERYERQF
ncbi:MAG: sxtJ [Candidatus Eisenbacteria bacterium]|uniref:SxtJ n=1 Tax=Eiseniibacteriota bacterium TaxID=2212470 RepID=A0A956LXW6_UNCEI|nr:sxtJ [Candidatus Eisenbacteria bacterium]